MLILGTLNNGLIINLTERFRVNNLSLKDFLKSLTNYVRFDVQYTALCLASPYDAISITYSTERP